MDREIEPGLLQVFRYFSSVALCYFSVLILYTVLQTGQGFAAVQIQWYLNFASNLALFIYLSMPSLHHRLGKVYLPIAISIAAAIPILSNLVFLAPQNTWQSVLEPTWLMVPTLLVIVVLLAWQYTFLAVLAFTVGAAVIELIVVYSLVGRLDADTLPILGLPLVQAFSFGIVGYIVSRMVSIQRTQRRELIRTNIQLSQHAATVEQLTLSRERNRLARELHDTLAHTLSGQAVNLEATKLMLAPNQPEVEAMLNQALETTRNGLAEVRRALKDLRSQTVEDLGLPLAIRNLALEAAARADFALKLEIADELPRLNAEEEHTIYRIAQESLANVVKHAEARQVKLRLGVDHRTLTFSINDDGHGIDLDQIDYESKHGLLGMKERAAMVNGNLEVKSNPGAGTTVCFSLEVRDG
ncbi:MAG TPA: sensor histidine kinase [Longilinea sp.]|nr:sensor histidine kinase [Longilinea sp.]